MIRYSILLLPLLAFASLSEEKIQYQEIKKELAELKEKMNNVHEDLDERLPIIEENERHTILDKINFAPEVLLRFDKFHYKTGEIEGEDTKIQPPHPQAGEQRRDEFTKDFSPATFVRFRLNMSADMGDAKFYGRLLYSNSSQSNERICILSRDIKSGSSKSSAFDVDRAYVDYSPNKNSEYAFTFTFGLLPTTDGTPMQFKEDKPRSALFPALVFDMNTYGMIATQKLSQDTFVRFVVAKAYTLRENFYPYQCNRENIYNAGVAGIYADTKFYSLGKGLLSFGANALHNLKAQPYLGPDMDITDANNLGTMLAIGLGVDIQQFLKSDATLFLHSAISIPFDNGAIDDYQIKNPIDPNDTGFTEANYATGPILQKDGYALYLGTKYDLNEEFYLGAEYNYGSKYWFSATQGAEDMFNKLATRGHAVELYTTWKYHKYLSAKLSYLGIKEEYTGSGWHFGEPAKKDAQQDIFSLTLEAKF